MKLRLFFITFIAAVFAVGTAGAEEARYSLNVANFSSLTIVDGINVIYSCNADSAGWVVFSAEPEVASKLSFSNNKEHLKVQTLADENPIKNTPTVRVYSASLRYAENSGDSTLRINATEPVQKFTARQIGNGAMLVQGLDTGKFDGDTAAGRGRLSVSGKARQAKLRNVGTGYIDASALVCDEMTCFIIGPGNIDVNTAGSLKISGAGSGKVVNRATASKTVNRSIGVKAIQASEEEP